MIPKRKTCSGSSNSCFSVCSDPFPLLFFKHLHMISFEFTTSNFHSVRNVCAKHQQWSRFQLDLVTLRLPNFCSKFEQMCSGLISQDKGKHICISIQVMNYSPSEHLTLLFWTVETPPPACCSTSDCIHTVFCWGEQQSLLSRLALWGILRWRHGPLKPDEGLMLHRSNLCQLCQLHGSAPLSSF